MAQKIGLEAIIKMASFNKGMKQYTKGITGMEKSTDAAGKGMAGLGSRLGDLGGSFTSAVGSIAAVAGALYSLKKVYDFGKEGAVIAQTKQSFDDLMTSMGVAPNTLQLMRDATLGTVDDMTLMSSTMTLLAGTSDNLGNAMVENAPQLLEIAKAANKLNPTLGDTAFLYQSLATGIKRSSPLILDNLGLVVKVGDANEKMAAKLDKSVEALTAEEKSMALLEAALFAGDRMIQQVGGSVEAMGDKFAVAEVRIKNATDTIKAQMAPVIADTVEGGIAAADTANQFITLVEAALAWAGAAVSGQDATEAFSKAMGVTEQTTEDLSDETGQLTKTVEELGVAQYEASITTDDLAKAQKALDDVIKDIQKRYESFFGSLSQGIVKHRELGEAQAKSAQDYAATLKDLNKQASAAYSDIQKNFEASLPDKTTVAERMGMAGDAWDEWALRIDAIIEGGVTNPWYQALQDMGYSKPPDVGLVEWLEGLKTKFYAGQLPDLLPPEWAERVRTQQEEATRIVEAENAKRRAAAKAARDAELAEEQAARNLATIELALTLAEQSGLLQAWSTQRFGPDFSQVGDTAKEVLAGLQSGTIEMDTALQTLIQNMTLGVQQALDTTGAAAEENQAKLDEIASTDWAAEKQAAIVAALGPENLPTEEFFQRAQEMWDGVDETAPETPFDYLIDEFDGASANIVTSATLMGLDLGKEFTAIDLDWAAMVGSQVESWDKGMGKVQRAIQEKVIDKLEEIPTKIVVTVTTEQEGGTEGKQHGGPVRGGMPYVVGEAGPELFVPASPGTIIPNMPKAMSLPALTGAAGGGSTFGPTINLTMSPTINNGMDLAEFQALTLQTVERAIGGT